VQASAVIARIAGARLPRDSGGYRLPLRSITAALAALNALAFVVESVAGGATDIETLYRLGAMSPSAVWAGEWWRPFSATFLHFGVAHLLFNLVGLVLFGPSVEARLGRWRYLALYLLSGAGSMWGLAILGHLRLVPDASIVVGASGSLMGVMGALAGWLARSWRVDRAAAARRRARDLALALAIQSAIDVSLSGVTLAAHLFGFALGFASAAAFMALDLGARDGDACMARRVDGVELA
jgi:rhomboid protease GluP